MPNFTTLTGGGGGAARAMKRQKRVQQILSILQTEPELAVADVCDRTGASEATVRRALVELEKSGQIERTWGGVRLAGRGTLQLGPPAFARRLQDHPEAKKAIARAAAALLQDGDVVMIDGGTTTFHLAEFIATRRIRVITNSLVVAQAIDRLKGGKLGAEVFLCGGLLQPEAGLIVGPQAEAFLRQYRARWVFMSAAGVDEKSVTNYDESVLGSEQVMIEQAQQIVLLIDSSKLGRQAMRELCPTKTVDYLFTNRGSSPTGLLRRLGAMGVKVSVVRP
jgi:DeoR/GlpR family transcriptional regulator of sugar metabolism